MAITVSADTFITALKVGLSKVKDATTTVAVKKDRLTLSFSGTAVRYQRMMPCSVGKLVETAFDASLLSKLLTSVTGEMEMIVDGPELTFKKDRSRYKVPCAPIGSYISEYGETDAEEGNDATPEDGDADLYLGWIKEHPLHHVYSLKKAMTSIKDNITKTELVVEAEWGVSNMLRVKIVDAFHGLLFMVKLPNIPSKKKVRIRLPLSSFLLLTDITGDLYVDQSKATIAGEDQTLTCRFLAGSAFGSIDDMQSLVQSVDPQVKVDAKLLHDIVTRAKAIVSQDDDSITVSCAKERMKLDITTEKASVREVLSAAGNFETSMVFSPINLFDVTSCMAGVVQLAQTPAGMTFKSRKGEVLIYGALVTMEK